MGGETMMAIVKTTRKPFIAFLVVALLTVLPLQGVAFAEDGGDCPCCTVPEEILGATITELTGSEANVAIARALANEEVKILRLALLEVGYTPRVDQALAVSATWDDEEGTHQGLNVVIPFEGEGLGAAIIYGHIDGDEEAVATVIPDPDHVWQYSVVDGEAVRTVLNPCTNSLGVSLRMALSRCVYVTGLSPVLSR